MKGITPCLWFEEHAEEALDFYTSVFKGAEVVNKSYYGDAGPLPKGDLLTATIDINGQELMILHGGPYTQFTPAISFVINCEDQQEVDWYWEKLLEGGAADQCGWLKDKYGVSWQVVPVILDQLIQDPDAEKSNRVMQAMLGMVKIDIAELKRAYEKG
jgi:predicted 3-demethylubiquinone-9 3-methyltransferase (glyoxalase superfamily)